jgi:hypothetical protein
MGISAAFCPGNGSTRPVYATWWEMFPRNSVQVVGMTVKPGDKISASVVRTGTHYALAVTDATTAGNSTRGNSFKVTEGPGG